MELIIHLFDRSDITSVAFHLNLTSAAITISW